MITHHGIPVSTLEPEDLAAKATEFYCFEIDAVFSCSSSWGYSPTAAVAFVGDLLVAAGLPDKPLPSRALLVAWLLSREDNVSDETRQFLVKAFWLIHQAEMNYDRG
mgnify:CR=1 FL=1